MMQRFLKRYAFSDRAWPWGYFIYRTTYAFEADWMSALAKLDRYFFSGVISPKDDSDRELQPGQIDAYKLVYEGYRNVIIENPQLDGVDAGVIIEKHREWVAKHGFSIRESPRVDYCLMIDAQCLQSILASEGPTRPHGQGRMDISTSWMSQITTRRIPSMTRGHFIMDVRG
ncbi:hypothetical protein BDV29DRAFT_153811 [Aspergillus leporis]|uniref:Uncharacterized protein n=1 Tax=Aspergillus leporis TaxID=41062 RepID=A0A5N5X938_9EURO|nr:hypothetical protein BDV29DRAFT_153811 [Aspergillus leporis]